MAQRSPESPPAYDQTVYGESSQPTRVYGPMVQEPDVDYAKSQAGIAKIVAAVACLIGFIINLTADYYRDGGFVTFTTVSGFIHEVIWFFLKLVHAVPQKLANYYIELVVCIIFVLFLFISFLISAVHGYIDSAIGAVCFFCLVGLLAYTFDVYLQIRDIRHKFVARRVNDGQEAPVVE